MKHWHLIEEQLLLKEIFKEPPLMLYKRGRSLKDIIMYFAFATFFDFISSICELKGAVSRNLAKFSH